MSDIAVVINNPVDAAVPLNASPKPLRTGRPKLKISNFILPWDNILEANG